MGESGRNVISLILVRCKLEDELAQLLVRCAANAIEGTFLMHEHEYGPNTVRDVEKESPQLMIIVNHADDRELAAQASQELESSLLLSEAGLLYLIAEDSASIQISVDDEIAQTVSKLRRNSSLN